MPEMIEAYMSPDNKNADFESPDSFLFNDSNKPLNLKFAKGKRYLLRVVNTGAVACAQFHIDGYKLNVVEIDGVQMQPRDADAILICAGSSYGVVVQGKKDPKGASNWIAQMKTDMLTNPAPSEESRIITGELCYSANDDYDEIMDEISDEIDEMLNDEMFNDDGTPPPVAILDDFTMKPLDGQELLSPVDNNIEFTTNQTYFDGIGTRTPLNAQPWVPPQVPTLYTALTTRSMDPATYGPGVNPWVIKSGQIVQIHMENPHMYPHPMHLHGHVFQVVATGLGSWNGDESSLPRVPSKRDGFVVPAFGYAVIRFKADNPGVWFFHCHIDFHLVGGMAATIIESPDLLTGSVPPAGVALCDAGNKKSSGNCAGEEGEISAADASTKCNNVFNTDVRGAMTW
jgi:iron transport multicopper oxidase